MTYSRTRLRIAGAAALAAIALSIAKVLVTPAHLDGSTKQMVAAAAAHTSGAYLSIWLEMVAFALAALACITVTCLVSTGRGARLTKIGGWLSTVSFLALGFNAMGLLPVALAAHSQDAATVATVDQMNSTPALAPLLVLLLGGLVFPIVFGVGLMRAGIFGWWYPIAAVLGSVLFVLAPQSVPLLLAATVPVAVQWASWAWLLNKAATTAPAVERETAVAPPVTA